MSEENTNETTDEPEPEPTKSELHERVEQLESTVEKLMPSRRDALRMGAAGIAGAVGLSATTQTADAATGSAGQIGDSSNRPDIFADTVDANNVTGAAQGCRVFLSSSQSISQSTAAKIQFDSKSYDSGNNFDVSSHNWTCPEDGLYMANLQVSFQGGSDDQRREVLIGTGSDTFPGNEGAVNQQNTSDDQDRISVSTINKYSQGDTIAAYFRNFDSSDSVQSGSQLFTTLLEVAFLGGL